MQKKIINHHKLKRKWGRLFDRNAILPTDPALEKSRKDFAWKSTKQNPYYKEETSVKQKVLVYIGIMSVLLTIGVGIYHPFFYVKTVKVDGLERVSEEEFKNAVFGIIQYKKWYVFPGQNYFLINVHDIKDILLQRFPLSKIVVQKKFPHELS
ncbi:MAG TPA: hypothetical protein VEA18_02680, partial [Candidatus Kapabacteria bacterium]|nr:hypothetical protein [Candidatus Kapabacteria bacterium]